MIINKYPLTIHGQRNKIVSFFDRSAKSFYKNILFTRWIPSQNLPVNPVQNPNITPPLIDIRGSDIIVMSQEPRYSFLENNRFSRESSYDEKQLRELFNQGRIDRETELWLWDDGNSRLAGTYESLFIRNRRFKERRLGIYGAKNSGKTSFLDCCTKFGKKFGNGSIFVAAQTAEQTRNEISTIDFSLLHEEMAWEIRTQDYHGEQKTAKVNEWFAESDAILLLIDGSETTEQTGNIRLFLDQLRRRSPEGNRIDKPIAVIWTKTDLYENPKHRQEILELVQTFVPSDSVKEFSVSIFKPERMVGPILWCVRTIDEMKYENITQSGTVSKQQLLNEYRKLRDIWGINRGELGKKIETEISKLQQKFRRRFVLFAVAGNFIAFLLIFLVAFFVRYHLVTADVGHFQTAMLHIEQAENRKEVEALLEDYRNNFFSTKQHVGELETSAQEKIRLLSLRQTESAFRAAKYAIEHAGTPEKIDQTIEKFRQEATLHTPEQLEKLTALATKKRHDVQFEIAADWERSSYKTFREHVQKARTADDLKKAEELARQFLLDAEKRAALRLSNSRKADVERWKVWFDDLKREQPFEMAVKTISVPKSFFKGKNLEGKITITLQIGKSKTEISLPQLDEEQKKSDPVRLNVDLKCVVENAVWDEKKRTKITLTIAEYLESWRYFGRPASKAVCEVVDSEYPYIEFCPMPKGVFSFEADQSTITVTTGTKCLAMP